jgi:hypothetical protein
MSEPRDVAVRVLGVSRTASGSLVVSCATMTDPPENYVLIGSVAEALDVRAGQRGTLFVRADGVATYYSGVW